MFQDAALPQKLIALNNNHMQNYSKNTFPQNRILPHKETIISERSAKINEFWGT